MKAQAVFPFLTEGYEMYRNKTIEYYHSSKKAFTVLNVYDKDQEKSVVVGILFYEVKELSQKVKTGFLYDEFGIRSDDGMLECLYSIENEEGTQTFLLNLGDNVAIIKAKSVELVTEDVYAVG
ncbi:hypothetical protein QWT87_00535 [Chryseobacterium sp. APV1]|uniref:Uncharacterized protein n=1 Tax=Chryseobacterium urinae TaxID=3058400 RepID=A0ABT8U149_9FLAO|nr:hypothetical protein [Chryseobacterium sp. APV1]MDO3423353.1 hypothetical protein [Chryseobacterium sp. APV1]